MSYNVHVDFEKSSIDKATQLLAGISGAADKAVNAAINRASSSGEAHAAKVIRGEYHVSAADFKKYTQAKRHIVTENNSTSVNIEFKGVHIPLIRFDTKFGKDGRVVTRVKRTSAKTALDHAFVATMKSGHVGIFERSAGKRLPIDQKMGPSTPQMMSYNEDVARQIGEHVKETFEKRLDSEVNAILNGWRQ